MLRRLLVALLGVAVLGTGPSPCLSATLAKAPAADAHAAHGGMHDGGCHEPALSLLPRCDCGCTSELPRGAANAFAAPWALAEGADEAFEPAAPAATAPAEPLHASERPARIDHVPIVS